jgi:hypothetical protein
LHVITSYLSKEGISSYAPDPSALYQSCRPTPHEECRPTCCLCSGCYIAQVVHPQHGDCSLSSLTHANTPTDGRNSTLHPCQTIDKSYRQLLTEVSWSTQMPLRHLWTLETFSRPMRVIPVIRLLRLYSADPDEVLLSTVRRRCKIWSLAMQQSSYGHLTGFILRSICLGGCMEGSRQATVAGCP